MFFLAVMLIFPVATKIVLGQTYRNLTSFDGIHGAYPEYPNVLAQGRDGNFYGTTMGGGIYSDGVVFRITPRGALNVLYNFQNGLGYSAPWSGLTLGTDGSFYGTTESGTIFKITPNGSLTTLYTFSGGEDGSDPIAPPIEGADGLFYGTSYAGTVYKINSAGAFTLLGSLPGHSAAPLIQATDGNFYGTTADGGDSGAGTLFKITRKGIVTVLFSFDSIPFNTTGSAPFAPLVQARDGNFYGTTFQGGSMGGGVVFKSTPTGIVTVLHNFDPNNALEGYAPYAGLVQATDGNLYGVTYYGGPFASGVIFKIAPAGAYSVLYSFDQTDGGLPTATPMQSTNGKIYGLTAFGGTSNFGVVYGFDDNLKSSVKTLPESAKVGKTIQFLGQGFKGTTSVSFNGTVAIFTVNSGTYLTATVPSGATTGFVTVTTPGGKLTSVKKFRILP
jgi:uncharacterized repeat protein (TIGR03803 family)